MNLGPLMWVRIGFITAGVLLAATAWTVNVARHQTAEADAWVRHTRAVLESIAAVREAVLRIDAAQADHALTGAEASLRERDSAMARALAAIDELALLVRDNQIQTFRVMDLRTFVRSRIERARNNTIPRVQVPGEPRMPGLSLRQARANDDAIYEITNEMRDEELALLQRREEVRRKDDELTAVALAWALVLGVAVLVPAYWLSVSQIAKRLAAQRRTHDLVEDLPLVVWQLRTKLDGSREFEFVSEAVRDQRGLEPEALIRDFDSFFVSIHAEDRERIEVARRRSESELTPFDVTYRTRGAAGSWIWVHSSASLRKEPDGTILWNGYWLDVTKEKSLEDRLLLANKELEAFSYSVSHDLRAPLASIDGYSHFLSVKLAGVLDEKSRHFFSRIRSGARQMGDLIDGLLALSQINRAEVRRERFDLSALAAAVAGELRETHQHRQVSLVIQDGMSACGDERMVRQVLVNLMGNAWKFTRDREDAQIEIGEVIDFPGRRFYVKDNGVGFDAKAAANLFAPFQRFHDQAAYSGTGIGLATVHRIVERHGGRVWAESAPGEGATFWFTLSAHDLGATRSPAAQAEGKVLGP